MAKAKLILAVAILILFTILPLLYFTAPKKTEQPSDSRTKSVISIQVKEGDTLWGIASQYYTEEYKSIPDYIKEVKESNHISDNIFIGQHLIIPLYKQS